MPTRKVAPSKRTTPAKRAPRKPTAAEREALDEPIVIEFDGETYELPAPADVDYEVAKHFEAGDLLNGIEGLFGDQFEVVKSNYIEKHGRFTIRDWGRLSDAVMQALGYDSSGG